MNRRLYALHRWISAVAFVQLAAWTLSGTFFAVVPIEKVRGTGVEGAHRLAIPDRGGQVAPAEAIESARQEGLTGASSLELRAMPAGVFYLVSDGERGLRLDANTGRPSPVTKEEAVATARRDQSGAPPVASAALIERDPDIEYRDKPLPAWQVRLDDGSRTVVYVDATTGDVTARRSDLWRWYDFLWSLHIMDYDGRDNFNHPLLIAAALLALLTVVTGITLWCIRLVRWLRRRRRRGGSAQGLQDRGLNSSDRTP